MDTTLETRIELTATAVIWLSTIAAVLSVVVSLIVIGSGAFDPIPFFESIGSEFDFKNAGQTPSFESAPAWQGGLVGFLWMAPDLWGAYFFLYIRQLFIDIRKNGVFRKKAAQGVRRVGWNLVILIAILFVCESLTVMALAYFAYDQGTLSITVEDTHFCGVIIGLVILALGTVMADATRLNEENRAFV